jgi:ribosomal protein S30
MSGAEWEMTKYGKTRKYLLEKYPQSQEEAKMFSLPRRKNRKNLIRLIFLRHEKIDKAEYFSRSYTK